MPFAEVCRFYSASAASIDAEVTTVFLAPPSDEPEHNAHYLNAIDLQATRAIAGQIDAAFATPSVAPPDGSSNARWDLVLCHRYRAYWAAALSHLDNRKCVAVAHEFGMLRRWQRRVARRIYARDIAFAGVSPAVTAELAESLGHGHLLPNGIDLASTTARLQPREDALERLGLPPGPFTIGVVGRLHYKKRPELAMAVYREFRSNEPNSRLVFVGEGELQADEPPWRVRGAFYSAGDLPRQW